MVLCDEGHHSNKLPTLVIFVKNEKKCTRITQVRSGFQTLEKVRPERKSRSLSCHGIFNFIALTFKLAKLHEIIPLEA